jgi:hypothetical protein
MSFDALQSGIWSTANEAASVPRVGVLRLRIADRKAIGNPPLRMTRAYFASL